MVHRHHVVYPILIIIYHQHHLNIINMVQHQMQLVKQQQQQQQRLQQVLVVECIDANHSYISVTATMIFHRNVSRAIRPSDQNCKYSSSNILNRQIEGKKKNERKSIIFFFFFAYIFVFFFSFFISSRSFLSSGSLFSFYLFCCQLYPGSNVRARVCV